MRHIHTYVHTYIHVYLITHIIFHDFWILCEYLMFSNEHMRMQRGSKRTDASGAHGDEVRMCMCVCVCVPLCMCTRVWL
jgi:hypothetical protein